MRRHPPRRGSERPQRWRAGTPNAGPMEPRAMSTMSAMTADAVGAAPAPRPSKKIGTGRAGIRHDRVEGAVDVGKRRARSHHGRLHALIDAVTDPARNAEQLDAETELARESGCRPA